LLFLNLRLNKKFNEIWIAFRFDVLIYKEQIRRILSAFALNQPIVVASASWFNVIFTLGLIQRPGITPDKCTDIFAHRQNKIHPLKCIEFILKSAIY